MLYDKKHKATLSPHSDASEIVKLERHNLSIFKFVVKRTLVLVSATIFTFWPETWFVRCKRNKIQVLYKTFQEHLRKHKLSKKRKHDHARGMTKKEICAQTHCVKKFLIKKIYYSRVFTYLCVCTNPAEKTFKAISKVYRHFLTCVV